ncbi:hypothetical protein [Lysobacter sp. A289]
MRASCLSAIVATVALPLITACGVAGDSGGQSMAQITSTIEKSGFTCEVMKRHPKAASQARQCRANQDKYIILTVSQWNDPKERDQMYGHRLPKICDTVGLKDQVRWSTSDNWLLVAGGGKEKDVKALDEATAALGFEPHAVACQ